MQAVEKRAEWLRWSGNHGKAAWERVGFGDAMSIYQRILRDGETFYMEPHFSRMVEHARESVPDTLAFDATWLHAKAGWLWLDEPCVVNVTLKADLPNVPETMVTRIRAIGWYEAQRGETTHERYATLAGGAHGAASLRHLRDANARSEWIASAEQDVRRLPQHDPHVRELREHLQRIRAKDREIGECEAEIIRFSRMFSDYEAEHATTHAVTPETVYQFACFQQFSDYEDRAIGFGCWSYFTLRDGDVLLDRIRRFEHAGGLSMSAAPVGALTDGVDAAPVRFVIPSHEHEIRWIYAALYLMAQRLAVTMQHDTDRTTRRRIEKRGETAPPFIRVVTLRRLEADREREAPRDVEWRWHWVVRGFWRNQWYPAEGVHKPKFIESYIKGDTSKPLKSTTHTVFTARR